MLHSKQAFLCVSFINFSSKYFFLLSKYVCGFALVAMFGLTPVSVNAGELDQLKAMITDMEERHRAAEEQHQREMAILRAQIEALSKNQQQEQMADERITELEGAVEEIQEEQVNLETEDDRIDWTVYALLEYEDFDNTTSEFDAKNIELLVNARLTDRLHMRGEIEFEGTATTEPGPREGAIEVEQGWIQYDINRYFNPRAGVVLVPFSKFNEEHFDPLQDLTDRPLFARRLVPTTWSEAGVGFIGDADFGKVSTNYEFYVINGLTDEITDRGLRSARGSFRSDNNDNKAVAGHLGIIPFTNLELGFSGYYGEYSDAPTTDDPAITGFGMDLDFTWKKFELLAEYARFDLESGINSAGEAVPDDMWGYYVQGNYHFWPQFLNNTFLARSFANPTFTAVARYGKVQIADDGDDGGVTDGDNEEDRFTLGLNYRPVESAALKFEYQFNNTTNEKLERGDNDGFIMSVTGAF